MRYVIATISLWCWKNISYNDVTSISKHNRSISRCKSNKKPMSLQYRVPIGVASNYGAEIFWMISVFVSSICFIHNFLKKSLLYCWRMLSTAWKVSKYGVFSGPYFSAFGLNTERYFVSLRIQSECGKIRTRKYSVFGHFSHSVGCSFYHNFVFYSLRLWY